MLNLNIEINEDIITERNHGRLMNHLMREAMTRHHRLYTPRHFERNTDTAPGGGYNYEKRSARWQKKKAAVYHHQKPLVYSGKMRAHILANSRITATQTRARLYGKNYYPMTEQRRREVEAISDRELGDFGAYVVLSYSRLSQAAPWRRKRKRKIKKG